MRAQDEERTERGRDGDEREEEEGSEAAFGPLDFRAAHALDDLLPFVLGLRRLPVLGGAEGGEEDEGACEPEEGEDWRGTVVSVWFEWMQGRRETHGNRT